MKQLAEKLKSLTPQEVRELAKELIGSDLTIGHKPVIHPDTSPNPNPTCSPGYYWDIETQSCILDVG